MSTLAPMPVKKRLVPIMSSSQKVDVAVAAIMPIAPRRQAMFPPKPVGSTEEEAAKDQLGF